MKSFLLILGQQCVWFSCILSAAQSSSIFGLITAAFYLSAVLYNSPNRPLELRFLFTIAAIAFGLDSLLVATKMIQFASPSPFLPESFAPPWMVALWLCFATLAPRSLRFLRGRYGLASAIGAIAGPLTYYSAMRMGAATMSAPTNLFFVGLEYAIAMPLLIYFSLPLGNEVDGSSSDRTGTITESDAPQ